MTVTPQTSPPIARIRELPSGDKVIGFYLLTKLETKPKRNGEPYLELRLQDSSGHIEAKMWEQFENFAAEAKAGDVIKVEGTANRYRELPELIVSRVRLAADDEVPDRRQFLPHSPVTADEARRELFDLIGSVTNSSLKALLEAVFQDESLLSGFLEAPGGKMWHHATLGGLAEHTISLAKAADAIAPLYPALDRDLLLTGALLHDIGKVSELATDVGIDYSVEGRLIGHIVQGTMLVEQKISELPDFPAEARRQVLHLILSHQGEPAMSSPIKPMTIEAIILHHLDELDSKYNAFQRVRGQTPEGQEFSDYVKLMERFFYFKPITGQSEDEDDRT